MFLPVNIFAYFSRAFRQSMFWPLEVVKVDFLVIDVLEVDVLGVRLNKYNQQAMDLKLGQKYSVKGTRLMVSLSLR
jgi:hypothetical protein